MKNLKSWLMPALLTIGAIPILAIFISGLLTVLGVTSSLTFVGTSAILTDGSMLAFTAMLAMTPITIVTGWQWPQMLKRPLGLLAFFYSFLHFLVFASAFSFLPGAVLAGGTANAMLLFGTIAFLLFIPLALTSNRWSMKKLGKNWKRLHYLVYFIAAAIFLHLLFLGTGLDFAILFPLLLFIRIPVVRKTIVRWRKSFIRPVFRSQAASASEPKPQRG